MIVLLIKALPPMFPSPSLKINACKKSPQLMLPAWRLIVAFDVIFPPATNPPSLKPVLAIKRSMKLLVVRSPVTLVISVGDRAVPPASFSIKANKLSAVRS